MCFKQDGAFCTLRGKHPKLVSQLIYLGSNISSSGSKVNIHIRKVCTVIDSLSIVWKSEIRFLLCCVRVGTTLWMQHADVNETLGEKLDKNYGRMLRAIFNKSCKQLSAKLQLVSHFTNHSRKTNKTCRELLSSKDEPISDVSVRQPVKTCIYQFCVETGCSLENLPGAMDDRDEWYDLIMIYARTCVYMYIQVEFSFI